MRTLGFSLVLATLLLAAGCAAVSVPPLSAGDVVAMAKQGKSAEDMIAELNRTDTVLSLRASDYVALHAAGVPDEVLDYLQFVQIEEIRWRERSLYGWYGPYYYGWPWYVPPRRRR